MTSRQPSSSPDKPAPTSIDAALDEALAETFPASDAINLRQWTEMHHVDPHERAAQAEPARPDKAEHYLKGPTSYCA